MHGAGGGEGSEGGEVCFKQNTHAIFALHKNNE